MVGQEVHQSVMRPTAARTATGSVRAFSFQRRTKARLKLAALLCSVKSMQRGCPLWQITCIQRRCFICRCGSLLHMNQIDAPVFVNAAKAVIQQRHTDYLIPRPDMFLSHAAEASVKLGAVVR